MDKSPDAFRTISEVADYLDTPAHVLRFWESRFPQIRPVKRAGGRRYYRPTDVALLAGIKRLLHDDGMTIRGVQKVLREQGVRHVQALSGEALPEPAEATDIGAPFIEAEAETAQVITFTADRARTDEADPPDPSPVEPEPAIDDVLRVEEVAEAFDGEILPAEAEGDLQADEVEDDLPVVADIAEPEPAPSDAPIYDPDLPEGTLPFTTPRGTPAPPLPDLPLFASLPPEPEPPPESPPSALAEITARLRALPPGAMVARRAEVVALMQRLADLLPSDPS